MKYPANLSRRLAAFLLTLVMLMTSFAVPAYAQADWEMLSIRLSWLDANGAAYEAYAAPVSWSQDQSYWVQVSADAPLHALTMNISHPNHTYAFDPADGSTLMNVVDAGSAMDGVNKVVINAYENDAWATSFNLYVSTQISMPEQPAPEPAKATVQIVYRSNDGSLYEEEYRELTEGGDNTVYARQYDGYTLTTAESVWVDVSANGANPGAVEFVYDKNLAKATVQIVYRSNDGSLYEEEYRELTEGGDNTVYARQYEGYTLTTAESVWVDVSASGANPGVVEFVYDKNLAKATVQIVYRSNDGSLYEEEYRELTEGGDNTVY
ncbi:MAG: hypothetical protein J6K13_07220, partial [Clostridia bacterium]|nr:hypothetical protein [Clostridia bacterium]